MGDPGERSGEHGRGRRAASADARGRRRERIVGELRRARPVARTVLEKGTVVYARVPFVERPDHSKARPAVVAGVTGRSVQLLPVTSSRKDSVRQSALYVALDDWEAAGLSRPCLVSRRPVVVDIIDVTTVVGRLAAFDADRLFAAGTSDGSSPPASA